MRVDTGRALCDLLSEANELQWENLLERMLAALQKNNDAISSEKKSAQWKVWIANLLKSHTAATNVWIADQLNMGAPQSVSMLTSRFKQEKQDQNLAYLEFTQNITKCPLFVFESPSLKNP